MALISYGTKLQPRSQGLSSLPVLSFLNDNGGREERPWERGWQNFWYKHLPLLYRLRWNPGCCVHLPVNSTAVLNKQHDQIPIFHIQWLPQNQLAAVIKSHNLICQPTYRPILGRHIGRLSVGISAKSVDRYSFDRGHYYTWSNLRPALTVAHTSHGWDKKKRQTEQKVKSSFTFDFLGFIFSGCHVG